MNHPITLTTACKEFALKAQKAMPSENLDLLFYVGMIELEKTEYKDYLSLSLDDFSEKIIAPLVLEYVKNETHLLKARN